MTLLFLGIFLVVASRCPDTFIGRHVNDCLLRPLVKWFSELTWRRAITGAVVSIGVIVAFLLVPEMAVLAAGVDVTLVAEVMLLLGVNAVRLRWGAGLSRVRQHAVAVIARASGRRPRTVRSARKPRPAKSNDPDGDAAPVAFARFAAA